MIMRDRSLRQQFAWVCKKKQKQEALSSAEASLYCGEAGEKEKESARFLFFRLLIF